MSKSCAIAGCPRSHYARGYCDTHYRKFRRDGSLPLLAESKMDLISRIWRKLERFPSGCWKFHGCAAGNRLYPTIIHDNKTLRVHSVLWQDKFGPVPANHKLFRTCLTPLCVNPDHHQLAPCYGKGAQDSIVAARREARKQRVREKFYGSKQQ